MDRMLTTREATVQTVQVEIKALKVGKKQVTMGLFRQLPYGELIDRATLQLRGVPWGHVRYFWDGDGSPSGEGDRLHVVWQRGEELRRAVIYADPHPGLMARYHAQYQDFLDGWVLLALRTASQFEVGAKDGSSGRHTLTVNGREVFVCHTPSRLHQLAQYWYWRDRDPVAEAEQSMAYARPHASTAATAEGYAEQLSFLQGQKTKALEVYATVLEEAGLASTALDAHQQDMRDILDRWDAYKAAWATQWQVLCALPQLFIAV